MNFKILVKSILRVIKDSEVLENYERKIAINEMENYELENDLKELMIRFSDYKFKLLVQNEKIDKYESLDQKLKILVSKIPLEIEGLSSEEMYEKYESFDKGGGVLYDACEEIIKMDFNSVYIIEDILGWFENSDGNDLIYYRELYEFGTTNYKWVNDSMDASNAEIVDTGKSEINYNSEEYKKYKKELYSKALVKLKDEIINSEPDKRLSFIEQTIVKDEKGDCENNYCNTNEEEAELEI